MALLSKGPGSPVVVFLEGGVGQGLSPPLPSPPPCLLAMPAASTHIWPNWAFMPPYTGLLDHLGSGSASSGTLLPFPGHQDAAWQEEEFLPKLWVFLVGVDFPNHLGQHSAPLGPGHFADVLGCCNPGLVNLFPRREVIQVCLHSSYITHWA